jgi:hypothetical protein
LYFGLGESEVEELVVSWPSGDTTTLSGARAGLVEIAQD